MYSKGSSCVTRVPSQPFLVSNFEEKMQILQFSQETLGCKTVHAWSLLSHCIIYFFSSLLVVATADRLSNSTEFKSPWDLSYVLSFYYSEGNQNHW